MVSVFNSGECLNIKTRVVAVIISHRSRNDLHGYRLRARSSFPSRGSGNEICALYMDGL